MNHPEDYMNGYRDSSSSDSSNVALKITPQFKSPAQIDHQPTRSKKTSKIKQSRKKQKVSQTNKEKKLSASQYLILGDNFFTVNDVQQITRRFIQQQARETARIMQIDRLRRKQKKCVSKIEKYIKTFSQNISIVSKMKAMSVSQKQRLYQMLKQQYKNGEKDEDQTQKLFQEAVGKVETLSAKLFSQHPYKEHSVAKWKNCKLHQLQTINLFIERQQASRQFSLNLEQELEILEEEKFFPEIKLEAEELQATIINHIKKKSPSNEGPDEGVQWLLVHLKKYILQNEYILDDLASRIQQGQQLLSDKLYVQFSKQIIGIGEGEDEINELKFVHTFNKCIFDFVNQTAHHLVGNCPCEDIREMVVWILENAVDFQPPQEPISNLLGVSEEVMEILIEQALWDFLDLL